MRDNKVVNNRTMRQSTQCFFSPQIYILIGMFFFVDNDDCIHIMLFRRYLAEEGKLLLKDTI